MADPTEALLVPIQIDALLVNAEVASGTPWERWNNNWSNLSSFQDPVPPPLGNTTQQDQGIYLHWHLPAALTHGHAPRDSTSPKFPHTPNRWIVVRLTSSAQGTAAQTMTAWIIESDYLDPNLGTTPYIDPSSTPGSITITNLGRHMLVSQYSVSSDDGNLFLTATGIAQTGFLAYQPGLGDVYSFLDSDAANLTGWTYVTYLVAGCYSNSAFDPLNLHPKFDAQKNLFTDLNWLVLGLSPGEQQPNCSVFHGMVNDLVWNDPAWQNNVPPRVDPNANSMQIAVGYTAIDALAALLAQSAEDLTAPFDPSETPVGMQIEMMLSAFQQNCLHLLDQPDATAQMELRIRDSWFGSTPGGTMWEIVEVAQGQVSEDPISRKVQRSHPRLTQYQEILLAAVNTAQNQLDVARRELRTLQWQLFALWWKSKYASNVSLSTWVGAETGVSQLSLEQALSNQLDSSYENSLYSLVAARQQAVAQMQSQLPDPTSKSSIERYSREQIPDNEDGRLRFKPNALPPFCQPSDPVLLIAGITPPAAAPDASRPLPCRVTSAATTGVNVVVNNTNEKVLSTADGLANIIQQPGTLTTSNGESLASQLDPLLANALAALSTEVFFADPNNATSITNNGLSNNNPTVISDLQAAITNEIKTGAGNALVATIQNPVQANFAFALWQQAWAPLYLEWQLQFYPTVQTSPTGQSLPLNSPPNNLSDGTTQFQDNLPMDLTDWSFNAAPGVSESGFEYYTWGGEDIWTNNTWLVPQKFVGRSLLTPNSQTLFLARLKEFISKKPVAAATAVVIGDAVTSVTVTSGGHGYRNPPAITFYGGGGSGAEATAVLDKGVITGINVANGGSGYNPAAPPQVWIGNDWSEIKTLIDNIGQTQFLSQTLSGFNDNFLMQQAMHTQPPDAPIAGVIDGQDRNVPNPALGDGQSQFGQFQPFFFPVRGGFFQFIQLQIVDGFGQVLDLLTANGNSTGEYTKFQPILGAGLLPDQSIASNLNYQTKQAPRVVQPSRLNLTWLDAFNDDEQVFLTAATNPVCGWLIPNHLDHSIEVYDAGGGPLGELLVLMQASGDQAVVWLQVPGSPSSVSDPSQIPNPHLRAAISAFTTQGGTLDTPVSAFNAWFNSIDETLWTVDPPGGQTDGDLAVLIGRPLAVTRMQLGFELYGRPAYNQSWRDTFDLDANGNLEVGQQEAGFTEQSTSTSFPIQLGSTELLDDGVIGYFLADNYSAFNAVHPAASPTSSYIEAIGGTNVINLCFDYPTYTPQILTLLIDPLASIHATTGVLPVQETKLPPQFYSDVISRMAVSFRIGPILTDPESIRVPVPTAQPGDWSWVWQTTPGTYEKDKIVAANAQARLESSPPHMMDGWLVLKPSQPKRS